MYTSFSIERRSALSVLFSRYMNGDINESAWRRMMNTIDQEGITRTERLAFARFMNEVIDEKRKGKLNVPAPEEMKELLRDVKNS